MRVDVRIALQSRDDFQAEWRTPTACLPYMSVCTVERIGSTVVSNLAFLTADTLESAERLALTILAEVERARAAARGVNDMGTPLQSDVDL